VRVFEIFLSFSAPNHGDLSRPIQISLIVYIKNIWPIVTE